MENKEVLLKVRGAKTYFPIKKGILKKTVGYVKAVDDISLDVYRGETLGLVGIRLRKNHAWQIHPAARPGHGRQHGIPV